ncbi:MAG: hypothetical protein ACI8ZQ_000244, partial [Bacteroidia bacterium]
KDRMVLGFDQERRPKTTTTMDAQKHGTEQKERLIVI